MNKFFKNYHEFMKEHRLIVEACNKFLIDEDGFISTSEIFEKLDSFNSMEDFKSFFKKNYILTDLKESFKRYEALLKELGESQDKLIVLELKGDEILVEFFRYKKFINSMIHIFRNIVEHGIESIEERVDKAKPKESVVTLSFHQKEERFSIFIEDDGRGIDPSKIKRIALSKGLKSEEYFNNISDNEIISIIFEQGFSTKEETSILSGRGVGMNAVKNEVENLNGTIDIKSSIDIGTKFLIDLPLYK